MAFIAVVCSLAVGAVGWGLQYALRRRSIAANISAVVLAAVAAITAGVLAASSAMFISSHDLHVLLIVLGVAGIVSLGNALWLGRRLAAESVWAAQGRERERSLEASRRELVAWVSHDLRTPLAGLRAMSEALADGVVTDASTVDSYHSRLRMETDRMSALVDDLFELSRINAGALRLTLESVDLADVVSDAVASALPVANASRVRLVARPGSYPAVQASEIELGRVLGNLLINAIRHTPAEGVVTVTGGADGGGAAWLAVADACGGIPEDDLPRVFDVAFRGTRSRTPPAGTAPAGGGGLGLAIARGLVEAHRGEIAVSNTPSGCRFVIRLPAEAAR
ncbi:MAG: two-component sensor histidine kinase [Pseudonocardiales bacterium]|nr:MAG: two-component sensor histidine kinase [Pseudonocardiales bacterium]